jgi:HAD superfamily hydrolase (TIGR01490 family)
VTLAIFDLDNTLIAGDSDYLWGQFLGEIGAVDAAFYAREHDRFYQDYVEGTLDIHQFLRFQLGPLAQHAPRRLERWREQFMEERIRPILLPKALDLLARHRESGHTLLIITATNRFITAPIADALGVPHLIATDPEFVSGRYTGGVAGTPSYAGGKVDRLREWLTDHDHSMDGSWFYSDSHNDLPLLRLVSNPVAVDPDESLYREATRKGWPVISLR